MLWVAALLPVVFVPGWTGSSIPTGWLWLSVTLPFLVRRRVEMTEGHWLGLMFLGYALLSLSWAPFYGGVEGLWHWGVLALAFIVGSQTEEPRDVYIALAIGIGASCLIAIPQWFGWNGIFQFHPVAGLFINSNVFGETCAVAFILLVSQARKPWFLAGLMAFGLLISQARVAMAAVAVALCAQFRSRTAAILVLVALAGGLLYATQLPGMARYKATENSITQRARLWLDTFDGLSFRGHGVGSFESLYPAFATRQDTLVERPTHAHNEYLELLFDFGLGGCALLILIAGCLAGRPIPETFGLLTFLIISAFSQSLSTPVPAFLAAYMAGRLVRARAVVRADRPDSRQPPEYWMGPTCYRKGNW